MEKSNNLHNIVIVGSFTIEPLKSLIECRSQNIGQNVQVAVSPYNQVLPELLNSNSLFSSTDALLRVVFIRVEDWLRDQKEYECLSRASEQEITRHKKYIQTVKDEYIKAIKEYAKRRNCQTDIVICPSSDEFMNHKSWSKLIAKTEQSLIEKISGIPGVQIYLSKEYQEYFGLNQIDDALRNKLGHIPYTDSYYEYLAVMTVRRIHCLTNKPYKVIVSDCDYTLWDGVAAEKDGAQVPISEKSKILQQFLKNQYEKGFLLCLCSKNAEEDVWKVFEKNENMILKREYLADWRINWKSKSENLYDLANSLNLGLDSFIFIDDNEIECQEMKVMHPEVFTIHAKQDMDKWEMECLLHKLWVFDTVSITQEDKEKTHFYQNNKQREELRQNTSYLEFIKNLNLKVYIRDVTENSIDRVEQLFQKTNQFNFTTIRYSRAELNSFLNTENYRCQYVSVKDRFGSYGIVGVMLFQIKNDRLIIDSFILSCRVLGRGVEYKMLAKAAQVAKKEKLKFVEIAFRDTKRNEPARKFLERAIEQCKIEQKNEESFIFETEKLLKLEFLPEDEKREETTSKKVRKGKKENNTVHVENETNILWNMAEIHFSANESEKIVENDVLLEVKNAFSKVLNRKDIKEETLFEEYGITSYQVVDITALLVKKYPDLPLTILYECKNIAELTDYIRENCKEEKSTQKQDRTIDVEEKNEKDDIAVIGISGMFPGCSTVSDFWHLLIDGNEAVKPVPKDRWKMEQYYDSSGKDPKKSYGNTGGFLDDVYAFDAKAFHISPKEARTMDPQQRLLLQVVRNLYDDAGYVPDTMEPDTGVYIGAMTSDFRTVSDQEAIHGDMPYRNADSYQLANRISYFFDLHGPSLTVDTACSASGTALHLACTAIKNGDCKMAITGGVNLFLLPSRFVQYSQMGFLSHNKYCSPFGEEADGAIFGEGIAAVLLKPLKDAVRDRDNIYGVIKSTAVNSGGKTNGFTVPSPGAQSDLIYRALQSAETDANTISYFETHGTGTYLGDPIEIRGLTSAFEKSLYETGGWNGVPFCKIGSVKSNIGHLESAAFMAGMIKVLLQMRYHKLVPSLHSEVANQRIPFEDSPFRLQHSNEPWNGSNVLRAGISSFGAGGSNACAILEEYKQDEREYSEEKAYPIMLSARNKKLLKEKASNLLNYLQDRELVNSYYHISMEEIAYTLWTGREEEKERVVIVASAMKDLISYLDEYIGIEESKNLFCHQTHESSKAVIAARQWLSFDKVDWNTFYPDRRVKKVSLPGMTWEKERYPLKLDKDEMQDESDRRLLEILTSVEEGTMKLKDAKELIGGIRWNQ